jgi:hypothetical protein
MSSDEQHAVGAAVPKSKARSCERISIEIGRVRCV